MKYLFLKFTKKTFLTVFLGMGLLLGTQGMQAAEITSAQSGNWTDTTTWVGGVVPVDTDYVIIASGHNLTFGLVANTTLGGLNIQSGASLNVSNNFTFTVGSVSPFSNIAGSLTITGTSSRTFGNLTIASTGSISSTGGATSIASTTTLPWVNDGTVVLTTLGLSAGKTVENNGTFTCGMGSGSTGIFNNNSGATLTLTGTVAGNINNFGTMNSAGLSGTAATAVLNNKSTGVLNFTGGSMSATNLVLDASEAGNTVNYSAGVSQTLKIPATSYSKLILSGSGTKTIPTAASGTLCTGTLTIAGTAKATVTNTNVGVNMLILGTTGQVVGTIGGTGSGAATINATYFNAVAGTLNVQQPYAITSTAAGGDWNTASTWVDGIVPANSSADYVVIVSGAPVTLTLTAAFTVGALNIQNGGTLNVSGDFTFTIASRSPFSNIAGSMGITGTASRTIGNLTVASTGSISSTGGATSLGVLTTPWVNNGTITLTTLGLPTGRTIDNNGTFNCAMGSTSAGIFNNNSGATFNLVGTVAGTINNFGSMNSSSLSGTAATAIINNKASGVLNFTGGSMSATNLVLDASEAGNTVNYSAAVTQTIKPVGYRNLILSGSGTKNVALAETLSILSGGLLTVNEGVTLNNLGTITNNGDILLKSSATGSGSLTSTSSINNVTQQHYLSSNQRGWRLLSNQLASKTFNTLATDSGITLGTNYTGEYLSPSNTWTSTDGTAAMDTQKAYKVFITGLTGEAPAYATGPSNVTLINKGTAANTAPATINTVAGEFYLVANPYTAPVSVSRIIGASTGLSSSVAYYNPTNGSTDVKVKAGGYDTTTATGSGGSATDVVIPAMGAIFVQATMAGTIDVPATVIFTGTPAQSGTYNHKTAQTKLASTNALKLEVSSGGVYYDTLAFQFKAVGDAGSNIDFGKLPNSILDAYSFAGSNKMAVSELELKDQIIPLGITSTIQKNYTFKVVDNTIPVGYEAVLVDNVLNTNTVLTPGTTYNFAIDSNPASQGDTRFAINLRTAGSLGVEANELDASIQVYPNPSRGQFNITNTLNQKEDATIEISSLNGQVIHTQKLNSGTTTIQTKSWATGVYILKATSNGTQTTKKLLIQ